MSVSADRELGRSEVFASGLAVGAVSFAFAFRRDGLLRLLELHHWAPSGRWDFALSDVDRWTGPADLAVLVSGILPLILAQPSRQSKLRWGAVVGILTLTLFGERLALSLCASHLANGAAPQVLVIAVRPVVLVGLTSLIVLGLLVAAALRICPSNRAAAFVPIAYAAAIPRFLNALDLTEGARRASYFFDASGRFAVFDVGLSSGRWLALVQSRFALIGVAAVALGLAGLLKRRPPPRSVWTLAVQMMVVFGLTALAEFPSATQWLTRGVLSVENDATRNYATVWIDVLAAAGILEANRVRTGRRTMLRAVVLVTVSEILGVAFAMLAAHLLTAPPTWPATHHTLPQLWVLDGAVWIEMLLGFSLVGAFSRDPIQGAALCGMGASVFVLMHGTPLEPLAALATFPDARYSIINGFGSSLVPIALRLSYGVAVVLLLWVARSPQVAVRRLGPALAFVAASFLAVKLLNATGPRGWAAFWRSEEQSLGETAFLSRHESFIDVKQPVVTSLSMTAKVEPAGTAAIRGAFRIKNPWPDPIARLGTSLPPAARAPEIELKGASWFPHVDPVFGWYEGPLQPALAAEAEASIEFGYGLDGQNHKSDDDGAAFGGQFILEPSVWPNIPLVGEIPFVQTRREHIERGVPTGTWDERVVSQRDEEAEDGRRVLTDISVVTPVDWRSMALGSFVGSSVDGGLRTSRFVSEVPLPKALFIAAAPYREALSSSEGIPLRVLAGAHERADFEDRILSDLRAAIPVEERMLGKYPWKGFGVAEVAWADRDAFASAFPGGAFIGDVIATQEDNEIFWRDTVAHELAHSWLSFMTGESAADPVGGLVDAAVGYVAARVDQATAPAPRTREFFRDLQKRYFHACGRDGNLEPFLLGSSEGSPCASAVIYEKGALGFLAWSDLIGEEEFARRLRKLVDDHSSGTGAPLTRKEFLEALGTQSAHPIDAPTQAARDMLADLYERRVSYKNEVQARRDGDSVALTLTVGRFEGGVGPFRQAMTRTSSVPLGVLDCDGNPRIVKWVTVDDWNATNVDLPVAGPILQAGIDPWNEILDDGDKHMVTVDGEPSCP